MSSQLQQLLTTAHDRYSDLLEDAMFADSCIIRSEGERVSDGQGGWTVPTTDSDPIDCALEAPAFGTEQSTAQQMQLIRPWVVVLPKDTSVNATDVFIVGARELQVKSPLGGETWELFQRVLCEEVRP